MLNEADLSREMPEGESETSVEKKGRNWLKRTLSSLKEVVLGLLELAGESKLKEIEGLTDERSAMATGALKDYDAHL